MRQVTNQVLGTDTFKMDVVKITCFALKIDSSLFRPMITHKYFTLKNIHSELQNVQIWMWYWFYYSLHWIAYHVVSTKWKE